MNAQVRIKKAITLAMAFLLACLCLQNSLAGETKGNAHSQEKKRVSAKVYFALGDEHEFPLTEERKYFSCSDKIFTVIELNHLPKTKYDLAIVWKDPSETERERTQYPFTVGTDETRLWSWLSLAPARGAAMIQWINPAAGLEEFIGPWTVEVRINNKKISTKRFEVIC